MVGGMSTATELCFCACGGIVAAQGAPAAGERWRKQSTAQSMVYASGARIMSSLLGQMGPQQQQQLQCGMDGANSVWRSQFGGGLGRRGGADFLWLLTSVSATGDKAGLSDGGGGYGGGSGGMGGGGGGGRSDGPGDDSGAGDGNQIALNAGAAIWIWYNGLLETHPLLSKSLTAGLMNAVADLFCQVVIEKVSEIDWRRLASYVSIGLFFSGPGLHFWYGALPRIVTVPGVGGVIIRIALDQLIFTPLGMVSFFVALLILEDRRADIRQKLEKDWWPTVVANWKVWIPFQILNFGFIPPQLQVAATGVLGMVWSVFISYKGHT